MPRPKRKELGHLQLTSVMFWVGKGYSAVIEKIKRLEELNTRDSRMIERRKKWIADMIDIKAKMTEPDTKSHAIQELEANMNEIIDTLECKN